MKVEIYDTIIKGKVIKTLEEIPFIFKGKQYVVPVGYLSDGMSVPECLWSFISPAIDNRTLKSSILHDFMYENHIGTRKEADEFYHANLIENGFGKIKSWLVYIGVRIGGSSHY